MSLVEQLQIVNAEAFREVASCVAATCILVAALVGSCVFIWRKMRRLSVAQRVAVVGVIALATMYAGTKMQKSTIEYLRTDADIAYFTDTGSYVTNNAVYVSFARYVVPPTANFYGEASLFKTDPEDVPAWSQFYAGTVGDFETPNFIEFANATNYNFRFYTDWTPETPVHTNGVLSVNWGVSQGNDESMTHIINAVPLKTSVRLDDIVVATPTQAHPDVMDNLLDTLTEELLNNEEGEENENENN